jgi:hypothetical protein
MIIGHPMKKDGTPSAEAIVIGITHADCIALLSGKALTQTDIPKESAVRAVLMVAAPTLEDVASVLRGAFEESGKSVEEFRFDPDGRRV